MKMDRGAIRDVCIAQFLAKGGDSDSIGPLSRIVTLRRISATLPDASE